MMSPVPEQEENREKPPTEGDIEDTDYPDVIINADSSSEDDDDNFDGYVGYQSLSQDAVEAGSDEEEEENIDVGADTVPSFDQGDHATGTYDSTGIHVPLGVVEGIRHENYPNVRNLPNCLQVPDPPRPDKGDLLWNLPRTGNPSMDTGHAEKIKSAMANIHLPACNIPDWAKSLPDDQWQASIVNKLVKPRTSQMTEVSDVSHDVFVCGDSENVKDMKDSLSSVQASELDAQKTVSEVSGTSGMEKT